MKSDTNRKAEEFHLTVDEQSTSTASPVSLLAELSGLSNTQVKTAMQKGAVWHTRGAHTQRLRRAKKVLKAKDQVHLYYNQSVLDEEPAGAQLIADEGAYSVWYKPYGMYSQGSKWGDHCTINRWAETHIQPQRPAFIVHRLDRAASGLILIGHEKGATRALAQMFEGRKLDKTYRVIVEGQFPYPDSPLSINSPIDDKPALSHARTLSYDSSSNCSLVEVKIETGRKHQIRRHMAEAGYPIVGDRLHGNPRAYERDLQLSAFELSFSCPLSGEARHYQLPESLALQL